MILKNKATPPGSQSLNNMRLDCNQNNLARATPKPATQIERVLLALLHCGSLTCQEAEKLPVKARHLNSVISDLAHSYKLAIHRERERVPGYQGETCYLIRYSVYQDQQAKARQIIDQWRAKRSAPPIAWINFKASSLEKYLRIA